MFGFGKGNKYKLIFESEDGIHSHIYRERSKTAEILGDPKFINAWLNSPNQSRVSSVITREAENGDIPSIKQMVWYFEFISQNGPPGSKKNIDFQVSCLNGWLQFCAIGEKYGMNYAYYMMGININLYQIYLSRKGLADDAEMAKALKTAVSCARKILDEEHMASDLYDDPQGTLQDARDVVEKYGLMSQVTDHMQLSKTSELEKLIQSKGIDYAIDWAVEIISEKLIAEEVALQFVLEEIEAASQGNEAAKKFANASGIEPWEYKGAMQLSHSAIDGGDGPQQLLINLSLQISSTPDLMVKFRTTVVDKIMKRFSFGRYDEPDLDNLDAEERGVVRLVNIVEKNENSPHGAFVNINNDLGDFIERNEDCDDLYKMAYGYARRTAAAGMFVQCVIDRETYDYVSRIFKGLQLSTEQSVEFQEAACDQALELIESYTDLFDRELLNYMVVVVEGGLDTSFLGGEIQGLTKTSLIINSMKEKYLASL